MDVTLTRFRPLLQYIECFTISDTQINNFSIFLKLRHSYNGLHLMASAIYSEEVDGVSGASGFSGQS